MNDEYLGNLLIPEPPLQCTPSLAVKLGGSDPAIILQQIHYWLLRSNQIKDGHKWVYNSVRQWHEQFPWMSEKTISRHLRTLEKDGYLITGNYNRAGFDKTKWYRINYPALAQTGKPLGQNVPTIGTDFPNGLGQNVPTQEDNLSEPIPIDYQENNNRLFHEITSSSSPHSPNGETKDDEDEKQRNLILSRMLKVARLNDDFLGVITRPTPKQLKTLQSRIRTQSIKLLNDVKDSFEMQMRSGKVLNPINYLITMLDDAIKTEKEWKK